MMEIIDIKNIKMTVDESANASHIVFETKDGATVRFIDMHDFESIAPNDDITNTDAFPVVCHFLDEMLDFL